MTIVEDQPRQCVNCRFFRTNLPIQLAPNVLKGMNAGFCCRYAPHPETTSDWLDMAGTPMWARYPIVDRRMVCGEYQNAKNWDEY